MEWSQQQKVIYSWFKYGRGNAVIRARAGTGKSTTIREAVLHAQEESILICAFNTRIAEEMREKLPEESRAESRTTHSVGFSCCRDQMRQVQLDKAGKRADRLALQALEPFRQMDRKHNYTPSIPWSIVNITTRLAGLGKNIHPLDATLDQLRSLAFRFDCMPDAEWQREGWTVDVIAKAALRVMEKTAKLRDGWMDYDDMLYLPLINNWVGTVYDLVVVDEAQDFNMAQLLMAQRLCAPGGRIAVVGDDRQAIYGFRGADSDSLDRLKAELKAQEFGLTVTYRCGRKIVAMARELVPDFEAAETNDAGEVIRATYDEMYETAQAGDFILSCKNAPLVGACFKLLQRGKRARIEGRDIGEGIAKLVKKLEKKSDGTLRSLMNALDLWQEEQEDQARETITNEKLLRERIGFIADQAELLRTLAEDAQIVDDLRVRIETMFTEGEKDKSSRIILSSVHKAKGLEADRVFLLHGTFSRENQEERNIEYVAITRAKRKLYLVSDSKPAPCVALVLRSDLERWQRHAAASIRPHSTVREDMRRRSLAERMRERFRYRLDVLGSAIVNMFVGGQP